MTRKVLVAVAAILLAGLALASRIVGGRAEERLEVALQEKLAQSDFPFEVEYSEIDIGLTLSSVSVRDIRLTMPRDEVQLACRSATFSLPFSEVARLLSTENLEALHLTGISLNRLVLASPREGIEIKLGRLDLDFEHPLSLRPTEAPPGSIPDKPQGVEVWLEDLEIDPPEASRPWNLTREQFQSISKVDSAWLIGRYEPESRAISLDRFDIDVPVGSLRLSGLFTFAGDRLDRLSWRSARADLEVRLRPSGLQWGDPEETGRFTFENAELEASWDFQFDEPAAPIPQGTASLLLEGFKAEFQGRMKEELQESELGRILGPDPSAVSVERLSASWELNDEKFTVADARLATPYLSALWSMSADMDARGIKNVTSNILTLTSWSAAVDQLIKEAEQERGEPFPRQGENLVVDLLEIPVDELLGIGDPDRLPSRPTVVVLPFIRLGSGKENADWLSAALLAELGQAGTLKVVVPDSVTPLDPSKSLLEISKAFDAELVLEGSLRLAGERMRISLQLIQARTDVHLWADSYDVPRRDAPRVVRRVARSLCQAIRNRTGARSERLVVWEPSLETAIKPLDLSRFLDEAGAFRQERGLIRFDDNREETVGVGLVSIDAFMLLDAQLIAGRLFVPEEADSPTNRVAVIGQSLAEQVSSLGQPIGSTILLNGRALTVIGVMSGGFRFPDKSTRVWIPLPSKQKESVAGIGRLHPCVNLEQARAEPGLTGLREFR